MLKRRIVTVIAVFVIIANLTAGMSACSFFRDSSEDILPHLIAESEAESSPVRKADLLNDSMGFKTSTVSEQCDELIDILFKGFKPDFARAQPIIRQIYDKAVSVLNRYILNDFDDFERIHAIHDWLAYYIDYDFELLDNSTEASSLHPSFGLDGVFLRGKAVCDGFSKAFALLCGIEQIPVTRILGKFSDGASSVNHAWNKVKAGGKWYNIDVTLDSFHVELQAGKRIDILNHGYYLLSDDDISDSLTGGHLQTETVPKDVDYDCDESYDFHGNQTLGINNLYMTVTSQRELNSVFDAIKDSNGKIGRIELRLDFPDYDSINLNRPDAYISQITAAYNRVGDYDFRLDSAANIYPYHRYPRGVFVFLIYK